VIVGIIASRLISITLTTLLLVVLARLVYHILLPTHPLALVAVYFVGTLMFCSIAFVLASLAGSVAAANGVAQVLFMPMMFLSGATFPSEFMPTWLQKVSAVLPSTYYVAALKNVMSAGGTLGDNGLDLLVMAAFATVGVAISARFFRWT
jgi:ABC-2 type transport system permease protein